ncbi:hypothetical protein DPMN_135364 [Dreissena polymorpha]|uniref:Uncharacterized protein n=1 Tax=Dreissena polymorpha TaxID=45954 RepID=A0A9D4G3S1_DREPO|nr:hypothetical protein DPMN_135364 [Dreissena polymorpha]
MTVTVVHNLAQPEFHQHCNMHTTSKTYQDCRMFGQEKASHNVATGPCFSLSRLVVKHRLLIHGVRQTYLCDSFTPLQRPARH